MRRAFMVFALLCSVTLVFAGDSPVTSVKKSGKYTTMKFDGQSSDCVVEVMPENGKAIEAGMELFNGNQEKTVVFTVVNSRLRILPDSRSHSQFLETQRYKSIKLRSTKKIEEAKGMYTIADFVTENGTKGTISVRVNPS